MAKRDGTQIALGSGKVYIQLYANEIPTDAVLEVDTNKLGEVKGGATLNYKAEYYDESDDFGVANKSIMTKEEASLKLGIITWNGETLKKLASTARITTASGKRTLKIGGLNNDDGSKYVVRFLHEDSVDGDVRVTIVGKNTAGFSLAFAKDKGTEVDPEFKAYAMDTDGTLIQIDEEVPTT